MQAAAVVRTLEIKKSVVIAASVESVFQAVLDDLGPEGTMGPGQPFPMKLEAWPGGRWYRDLGPGVGHWWGTVQVIKPPRLLELHGPMFMSYPAVSHLQYRLAPEGAATRLNLVHRAMGQLEDDHMQQVGAGWDAALDNIVALALRHGVAAG